MTVRIGITGPIGCGKSTVARWLAEEGAVVVDADAEARTVLDPGTPELAAVVERFGTGVLRADGSLDRAALAAIVFADPAALVALEAIVHPAVRPRIRLAMTAAEASGAPGVVVEAIKLVEGGLAELCDEVWLVTCDPATQRARLALRGLAASDAERRISTQGVLATRLRERATRVIDPSGSRARARGATHRAWRAALRAAGG